MELIYNMEISHNKTEDLKHWYVVLTRTNAEYKVSDYFSMQGIENFLPVQNCVTEKNGKIVMQSRLVLPRMVFVRITLAEKNLILNTLNVFGFLRGRNCSVPTLIPDSQMVAFRFMLDYSDKEVQLADGVIPHGTHVVVCKGNLQGLQGELVRYENKYHILVRMDIFGCAIVNIPITYVKKIK